MASEAEIERIRKDTEVWRGLAGRMLRHTDLVAFRDGELDFLEQILERSWLTELSYRQAEWLLDIRESVERVTTHRGFSVRSLILRCHENRFDLDEDDQAWLEKLLADGSSAIRRREARRLVALARRLGEIDEAA